MKTNTREKILDFIRENGKARPHELAQMLGISLVAIHKQLKKLLDEGKVVKVGKAPLVFYISVAESFPQTFPIRFSDLPADLAQIIDKRYLYIDHEGHIIEGVEGFQRWMVNTKQNKQFTSVCREYLEIRSQADNFFKNQSWVDATQKLKATFPQLYIDKVFYQDFYSLPKFGKTKLGQLVLHGKQSQNKDLIKRVSSLVSPVLLKLIKANKIKAVAFIPHSIPRQLPFLKELERNLTLTLPDVSLVKAYSGTVPVAQKSLSKLEERVKNARNTIFVYDKELAFDSVLLIDDAVGSGATFNETAKKLKEKYHIKKVYGFAVVGSYKDFEVIKEI